MEHYVWLALMATLGTWFVTALGAATVVFFKSPSAKALNLMLGFSSGVMIAASFWSLLQPAIQRAEAAGNTPAWLVAVSGFLLGALFLWGSDKAVCFARKRAGMGMPGERMNRIIMLVLSITLHNIPEGMVIGVAPKAGDINVNVCKKKNLTNMRAAGSEESLRLVPVRKMSLEQCLEFLADDELLEVTPENLRLRKSILNNQDRAKYQNRIAKAKS